MSKDKQIQKSFVDNSNTIAEVVTDGGSFLFAQYDFLSESFDLVDTIETSNGTVRPLEDPLALKGVVLLPEKPGEYDDNSALIREVRRFIHKYVTLTEFGEMIATYYVLLSWVYDCFETIPYLRYLGDFGTGKTRALKTIGNLCYKAIFAGGSITPSPLFRCIELHHGTLIIDEADFSQSDTYAEIVKILNCGYTKGMPVLRTEGDKKREPMAYDVFSPKIIGTRKRWKDKALESRCITERMNGRPRKGIPLHLPDDFYKEALVLRNCLLMFRFRNYKQITIDENNVIKGADPRVNQIVLPILSLISDPKEQQQVKDFFADYAQQLKSERGEEPSAVVLKAIIELHKDNISLQHKVIAEHINKDRPEEQGEYKISPTRIGRINSSDLGFKKRLIQGYTEIMWDSELAETLAERFGLEISPTQVDHVDDVDDSKQNLSPTQLDLEAKQ